MKESSHILSVRSLGHKGEGIGTLSGLVVFVEGALPGEMIEASLIEKKKRYARGKLLNIVSASPHRITPPCRVYPQCGGCQLMHLRYEEQLKVKTLRVKECLEKIAHTEALVRECLPSPLPFNWRHKVQLPVEKVGEKTVFGFYERGSHRLVPIESCPIHVEEGNRILRFLETYVNTLNITPFDPIASTGTLKHILLKTSKASQKTLVILITNGREQEKIALLSQHIMQASPAVTGVVLNINTQNNNVILGQEFKTLAGCDFLLEELGGCQFIVSPASFFQVNPFQAENMVQKILEYAELKPTSRVLDTYSGVGTMSIIMAKQAGAVVGIECVEEAVKDAEKNARLNHISNASFLKGSLEKVSIPKKGFDIVLLNPPRKGCEPAALKKILKISPKRIVYTSCDPATLARDLAILIQNGYLIDEVQPFDMFPQTMHVETVVKLSKK